MTYFVADEEGYVGDFATNSGLRSFRTAVTGYKELTKLLKNGQNDNIPALIKELEEANETDPAIKRMMDNLLSMAKRAKGSVIISDGVS